MRHHLHTTSPSFTHRRWACRLVSLAAWVAGIGCGDAEPGAPQELVLGRSQQALTIGEEACASDPRVTAGLVSLEVCAGARVFFDETFEGNGRTCATCHRVEDNYTISPEFIAALPASDPLFVGDQRPELAGLESSHLTDGRALIKEHVDGFEDEPNKFTLRSVQHLLSIGTTLDGSAGERTGWSGDGSPGGGLDDFLDAAIEQHFPRRLTREPGADFRVATQAEIRQVSSFQRALGRRNELDLASVRLFDEFAEAGRLTFLDPQSHCNDCHSNAGANPVSSRPDSNFDTGVERLIADADLEFGRFAGATLRDGGFGGLGLAAPNFPADAPNSFGNGQFNTPSLIEAADTGPFFHNNASPAFGGSGINAVVGFYGSITFNTSPAAADVGFISLPGEVGAQVGQFLRVLNAAFNLSMTVQRLQAADSLARRNGNARRDIQVRLIELARVELDDALAVLQANEGRPMYPDSIRELQASRSNLDSARRASSAATRRTQISRALGRIVPARDGLGDNLDFTLGEGNLMF